MLTRLFLTQYNHTLHSNSDNEDRNTRSSLKCKDNLQKMNEDVDFRVKSRPANRER